MSEQPPETVVEEPQTETTETTTETTRTVEGNTDEEKDE